MKYTINAIIDRKPAHVVTINADSRAMAIQIAADRLTADGVMFERLVIADARPSVEYRLKDNRRAWTVKTGDAPAADHRVVLDIPRRPSGVCNEYYVRMTTPPTDDELKANPDAVPVIDDTTISAPSLSHAYEWALTDRADDARTSIRCYLVPDDRTAYAAAVDVVRGVTTTLIKYRGRPMDYRLYVAAHKTADKIDDPDVLDMIGCAAVGIAEGLCADPDDVPAMYDRAYSAVNQYVRAMRGGTSISLEVIRECMSATRHNVRELLGLTRGDADAAARADADHLTAPAVDAHLDALTDDVIDSTLAIRLRARLTPKQARVLDLYMRGLSVRDICKATGTKDPKSVTQHIHAIRKHAAELIDAPAYAERAAALTAAKKAADAADAAALAMLIDYANTADRVADKTARARGIAYKSTAVNHTHWTAADRRRVAHRTIAAASAVLHDAPPAAPVDAVRRDAYAADTAEHKARADRARADASAVADYSPYVSDADRARVDAAAARFNAASADARAAALAAIKCRRMADKTRLDARARRIACDDARLAAMDAADRLRDAARMTAAYTAAAVNASDAAAAAHDAVRQHIKTGRRAAALAAVIIARRAADAADAMTARARSARRFYDAARADIDAAAADLDAVRAAALASLDDPTRAGYVDADNITAGDARNIAARVRRHARSLASVPTARAAVDAAAVARAHARLAADLIHAVPLASILDGVSIAHDADARAAARKGYRD